MLCRAPATLAAREPRQPRATARGGGLASGVRRRRYAHSASRLRAPRSVRCLSLEAASEFGLSRAHTTQEAPDDFLQASGKAVSQLVPLVTFAVAFLVLQQKLVVQPLQSQLAQAQAQTQSQLSRISATLEEVPRLAGRVERLDKEAEAVLNKVL